MSLRLPSRHVARPLDRVVTNCVASRSDLTAATNPTSRLLFPSRCAAQCYTQPRYGNAHNGSVSPLNGRSRATRELLLQDPATTNLSLPPDSPHTLTVT